MTDPLQSREAPCPHCAGKGTVTIPPEVATVEAYYFGCDRQAGHYWHTRDRRTFYPDSKKFPEWFEYRIDSGFCPGAPPASDPHRQFTRPEREGEAALHHLDGWTILAFWDRSVDKRGKCNSAFAAKGQHSFAIMLAIAGAQFPWVVGRAGFPNVVLVEGGGS